ncbi:CENP-Q, a CENPA-CAD centromere complex subunit-domain-containing protein, partial [Xylariaceae sp. FL0255]
RGRPSLNNQKSAEEANNRAEKGPEQKESQPRKRKRRSQELSKSIPNSRSSEQQDVTSSIRSSSPESDTARPYRYIGKKTRRVPRRVIESKWATLDESAVVKVAALLQQASRPVLQRVSNPKHYSDAETTLEQATHGLRKRSARIPFPPASTLPRREDELDFERTQSAVEVLRSQLDPLQHSVELLRREKERAEKELKREYKILGQLTANARAEAREKRDQMRKMHALVPEKVFDPAIEDTTDVRPVEKIAGGAFAGMKEDEEEIMGLAGEINNHMTSMRGNLQQIHGVLPAISKSSALLRAVLQPVFNANQLGDVMLGQDKR